MFALCAQIASFCVQFLQVYACYTHTILSYIVLELMSYMFILCAQIASFCVQFLQVCACYTHTILSYIVLEPMSLISNQLLVACSMHKLTALQAESWVRRPGNKAKLLFCSSFPLLTWKYRWILCQPKAHVQMQATA